MNDEEYMKRAQEDLSKQAELKGRKQANAEASMGDKNIYDVLNKRDKRVLKRPAVKQSPKR